MGVKGLIRNFNEILILKHINNLKHFHEKPRHSSSISNVNETLVFASYSSSIRKKSISIQ